MDDVVIRKPKPMSIDDAWDDEHRIGVTVPTPKMNRYLNPGDTMTDNVNHPSHYTGFSNGAEVIDITENLNFNRGNAVKYLARAGAKDAAKELEDLKKAAWYVQREVARLESQDVGRSGV